MKTLLLVAHGSRREESNREIRDLAAALQREAAGTFDSVACAFLELAAPSIPEGIETCIAAGATEVVVLPYFLAAGNHVAHDIPALVDEKRRRHPQVGISLAPYVGAATEMRKLILSVAGEPTR